MTMSILRLAHTNIFLTMYVLIVESEWREIVCMTIEHTFKMYDNIYTCYEN